MKSNFNDCLNRVLKDEGGYTNDPQDPGGPTNFGITLTDYRKYINKAGTASDVRGMNINDAKTIYKSKYWDALDCDNLSSGVDYTCFDYGVNSGLGRPRKALQQFKSLTDIPLINAINNERMSFLKALKTYPRFGKGWSRRVAGVRSYSIQLAQKKNTVTGTVVGTVTAGAIGTGSYVSNFWHNHEYLVIGGGLSVAIGLGYLVHYLINKGK